MHIESLLLKFEMCILYFKNVSKHFKKKHLLMFGMFKENYPPYMIIPCLCPQGKHENCYLNRYLFFFAPRFRYLHLKYYSCYGYTRHLRSSQSSLLHVVVPKTRSSWGDRAFSHSGPSLWNKLPLSIRNLTTLHAFKVALKTHLFLNSAI